MAMIALCLIYMVLNVINATSADVANIINYFNSDTFKTIQEYWQIERKSFQNALVLILEQNYGHGGMNVYVRKMHYSYKISDGFYFSDNIVDLVLLETRIIELPNLIAPEVTFALASNYLYVEARLGKIILNADYMLIRNQSNVIFTGSEQDPYKNSPFSYQQVQPSGGLTIIAQDCRINGYTITTFSGNTVNLGLDTFKVTNCKFSVEIYSEGSGSPPVFGPYFSKQQSITLEAMLSNPIRAELMPKLQAAVFTYINTSAIFGDELSKIRYHQNTIFKETSNFMSRIVGNFVKNTIMSTEAILQLKPVEISWNQTCLDGTCKSIVRLKDVMLYGLDSAYSAHIGGPYKLQLTKVAESIRFGTMQVRGKLYFENTTVHGEHDFAVELRDVTFNIEMEEKGSSFVWDAKKIDVIGWRSMDFSIIEMDNLAYERRASQSFITGYLVNEIPKRLFDHISKNFGDLKSEDKRQSETDKLSSASDADDPPAEQHELQNKNNSGQEKVLNSDLNDAYDSVTESGYHQESNSVESGAESVIKSLSYPSDNEVK